MDAREEKLLALAASYIRAQDEVIDGLIECIALEDSQERIDVANKLIVAFNAEKVRRSYIDEHGMLRVNLDA